VLSPDSPVQGLDAWILSPSTLWGWECCVAEVHACVTQALPNHYVSIPQGDLSPWCTRYCMKAFAESELYQSSAVLCRGRASQLRAAAGHTTANAHWCGILAASH
jgi:hypothetical protein